MKKRMLIILASVIGFTIVNAQPIAGGGFFYNDFSVSTFTGMTFNTNVIPGNSSVSLSGANVTGTPTGPLILSVGTTSGTTTDSYMNMGLDNYLLIKFSIPTQNLFNDKSTKVVFSCNSSQAVDAEVFITNPPPPSTDETIYVPSGRPSIKLSLTPGMNTYTCSFSGQTSTASGFFFNRDLQVYIVYNSNTGVIKPAGSITFTGITFGTSLTGYTLTGQNISTERGSATIQSFSEPSSAYGLTSFTSSTESMAYLTTIDGISATLKATGAESGTLTVIGTSLIYPYLTSSAIIEVSNNPLPVILPTGVAVSPATTTLGRNMSRLLATTLSPSGASAFIKWTSSDPSKVTVSQAGLISVSGSAIAGVVTITAMAYKNTTTVFGYAMINVEALSGFTITFAGTSNALTFSGIDPVGISTLGGITWSVLPTNIATINASTGALKIYADGVITITGISSGVTVRETLTLPLSTTPIIPGSSVSVNIYPNPAILSLNVSIQGEEIIKILLINNIGQVVLTTNATPLALQGLSKGIYILIIETSKGVIKKSISIE